MKQRVENLWLHFPAAKDALNREPLSTFWEPIPQATLKPESTLEEAITLLARSGMGFVLVLDDQQRLWGASNGNDLSLAAQMIAYKQSLAPEDLKKLQLREFVSAEPATVSSDDAGLVAATTMLEHGLTWIPVVVSKSDHHLKGYVRIEKMRYWLLQQAAQQTDPTPARKAGGGLI